MRAGPPAYDVVLLDRDGTLNERVEGGYVTDPDRLVLLPGAGQAVRRLTEAGCRVVVVTNQRALATGALTWPAWYAVCARLEELLGRAGGRIDATYVCPHEVGECGCRKPLPGLVEQALADAPAVPRHRAVLIGDMPSDVAAAEAAGIRGILLGGDLPTLRDAVDAILAFTEGGEVP